MAETFKIGRVFTPLSWAVWLIEVSGAFRAWLDGATVLDPTCGEGAFLEAFVSLARREGISITRDALARLHGMEIVEVDKFRLLERISACYDAKLVANNIRTADFITTKIVTRYDVIVGNPPWINFADLPDELKMKWAPAYIGYQLVTDKRKVLLGGSRADVATLILKKALDDGLTAVGRAAFFIPLSMFFNSGANDLFRPFPGSPHGYRVVRLWDFGREPAFEGISTRYGAVLFDRQVSQTWPVETNVRRGGIWAQSYSTAGDHRSGAWRRHERPETDEQSLPMIAISPSQKPRQGVNTCGANGIFIFERCGHKLRNGFGEVWELEEELLFPLMNAGNFGRPVKTPQRWILLPHDTGSGRPLAWDAIAKFQRIAGYLSSHREVLTRRRGTLINAHIRRGYWWALLGVGPYAFAPWKVAWEALGRKSFTPVVLEGRWQGNQALHAFCPCNSLREAEALATALSGMQVEKWLKSSAMEGTCNWAQPGRIMQVLTMGRQKEFMG
jgi:hypothetical protein